MLWRGQCETCEGSIWKRACERLGDAAGSSIQEETADSGVYGCAPAVKGSVSAER